MEVERERWRVEVGERMNAAWQRRVDGKWKEFRELYERKGLEEWQRREKKIKEEEEEKKASQRTDAVESSEEDDDEEKEKKEMKKKVK